MRRKGDWDNWSWEVKCNKQLVSWKQAVEHLFDCEMYKSFLFSFHQSYKPIVEFIDAQFEAYLQEELKIRRVLHNYHDTRIHACLYFIAPTGHSLKSLDLVTMKKLDSKVGLFNSYWAGSPCAAFPEDISPPWVAFTPVEITGLADKAYMFMEHF